MSVNLYNTMSEALDGLRRRGFASDFQVSETGLRASANGKIYRAEDVTIMEHHRFEGESDPDDMSIVYALESSDGRRGVLVDAYGPYANPLIGDFLRRVKIRETV